MSLLKKFKDYYKNSGRILFTTPSHNQGQFSITPAEKLLGKQFLKYDLSEIDGFDNLRHPHGVIKKLLKNISHIYDSKASFILTNGSTSGIIAAMLSILKEGEKVLVARNCHVSVYNGLVLSGAIPVWFLPDFDNEWGIYRGIKAEQIEHLLLEHDDIKALIITSPTYEGLFSDTKQIAKICRNNGVIFIVDEAHGALYNFGEFKTQPAIKCGADISVQSLHKTAGAPNPCALLHISKQSSLNPECVQNALNLVTTTSPSYAMLTSTEAVINYLNSKTGRSNIKKLLDSLDKFKNNLSNQLYIYTGYNDPTKLLIKLDKKNPSDISAILDIDYNIEEEFFNNKSLLFICGIGTSKYMLNKLCDALNSISKTNNLKNFTADETIYKLPEMHYSPRDTYFSNTITVNRENALNKTCAEVIINYPPGIPTLLPGEIITKDILDSIEQRMIKICC